MSWLRAFALSAREAGAFARQALLLPRDLAPVIPKDPASGDHVAVFLHGLFATAGVLRPMRLAIDRHPGLHTAALSYPPGPGAEEIARRLDDLLGRLPEDVSIHLVGHSLGGVVARYYAVTREDPRVASTIALATPFGGVRGAGVMPLESARDLMPESDVLRAVRLREPSRPIPHLSIIAGGDRVTASPVAHALPSGEVVVLEGRGHNAILFDARAIALVERRLLSSVRG